MRVNLQGLLRTGVPITMLISGVAGMVASDQTTRIATCLIGSALAGLFFALRFRRFRLRESEQWEKFIVDSKAAQRTLNDSSYGLYRRIIFGSPISENAFEYISIEDTLTSFVFMLICFGVGAVMWLEPSVADFHFGGVLDVSQMAKAGILQVLMVMLFSAGFSGVFLNVLRWIVPPQ
jgi:hypothetical protein